MKSDGQRWEAQVLPSPDCSVPFSVEADTGFTPFLQCAETFPGILIAYYSAIYRRFYEPTTHAAIQTTVLQEEKCWGQWGDYRGPFTFLVAFEKCVSPGGVKLTASQFDITDASAPKNPTDYTPQCRWQRRTEASAAFPGIATIIMCVGPRPFFRLPSWFFCSGFLALLILALPAKPRKAGNKDGSPEKKIHDSVLV